MWIEFRDELSTSLGGLPKADIVCFYRFYQKLICIHSFWSNQICFKRRAVFLWGSTVEWSWTADEVGLRAATKITQGAVLEEDEDQDKDEGEEDKDEWRRDLVAVTRAKSLNWAGVWFERTAFSRSVGWGGLVELRGSTLTHWMKITI